MDIVLEIAGFAIGLLYLWWEYNADRRLWLASVIMPAISMWIYFDKGLYADFSINIYYLVIAVYGYIVWSRGKGGRGDDTEKPAQAALRISHITPLRLTGAVGVFALVWYGIYLILFHLTDSIVPVADAFTTALSIVAMWMLARKYIEQWIAWIIVDIVCVWLYITKGIYLYATLYTVYTFIAMLGYRKWLRLMRAAA